MLSLLLLKFSTTEYGVGCAQDHRCCHHHGPGCLFLYVSFNCEHGVLRGREVRCDAGRLELIDADVEFGPEQLVARLPSSWGDEWEGALDCALPARLLDEGFEAACVSE